MKKILYVDMDGVIADFEGGIRLFEPGIEWTGKNVDTFCQNHPNLFEFLPVIEGAKEAIERLKENYEIYFLSTPMYYIPESYMGKRRWLKNHFGEWADKRLILTHRKDLCVGDILIDDRLVNGAGEFSGQLIQYGIEEFKDWDKIILKLLL